ncbi:MAG: phosphoribosylglycinamide formyltransferase [Campylobacterota bacterium]
MKKIVALFSGEGTNLANLIDKLHLKHCAIVAAITNNPEAAGIAKARAAGIPVDVLDHRDFESRESYDTALVKLIGEYQPDLVVLCGFMRILTPAFTSQVRSINLHPSLLPAFKGSRAIERSFESDENVCGVSVHWVTDELDGGEVIMQKSFIKSADETLESFTAKIRAIEHDILPLSVIALLKEA